MKNVEGIMKNVEEIMKNVEGIMENVEGIMENVEGIPLWQLWYGRLALGPYCVYLERQEKNSRHRFALLVSVYMSLL